MWILLLALSIFDLGRVEKNPAGQIVSLDLASTWITDADLEPVGKISSLRKLNLAHTRITDVGIEHLKPLQNVVELNLYYAEYLTDTALAHLRGWKHLEVLNLRGVRLTSQAFEHLSQLTALRSLDIAFTEVEDDGFEQLSSLTKLESLALGGNRLSGSALSSLKLLPALRTLDVGGMQRVDSGRWGLALSEDNLRRLSELTQLRALISDRSESERSTHRSPWESIGATNRVGGYFQASFAAESRAFGSEPDACPSGRFDGSSRPAQAA